MRIKLILIAFFCIKIFAQENTQNLFPGETVFHLKNYDNNLVEIKVERIPKQGGKWYPRSHTNAYSLIQNNGYEIIIANNSNPGYNPIPRIVLDTEGDDDENVLAISLYKLSFLNKNTFIYLNTLSEEVLDQHFTFDYDKDKLYMGNCGDSCHSYDEISNGTIINTFNNYYTNNLENYWRNSLFLIPYLSSYPEIIWGPIPDFNATGYKIFRAVGNSSGLSKVNYSLIATTQSDVFEYIDEAIDLSDSQYVFYYVAAYNSATNQNSQLTNLVSTKEIVNKWKASLLLDTSVGINPHLYWSEHPTFEATNYKIYRAISSIPNPRRLTYSLIHTTPSADVFEYTDTDMMLGDSDYVFYYVKAYNTNTNNESEASNVQTSRAGMYKQGIESEEKTEIFNKFVLNENYPNPFGKAIHSDNPSTTIKYSIPFVG